MSVKISFSNQKGGAAKTTSSAICAWLLSEEGKKVLAVDMDGQANLTETLTLADAAETFGDQTVMEAIESADPTPYIVKVTENLHLLPSDEYLSRLASFLYQHVSAGDRATRLRNTLQKVDEDYDYILIDTPPSLGEHTINSVAASDYVIVMFEPSKYCYNAIPRFLNFCRDVSEINPDLDVAGILCTKMDFRRSDIKDLYDLLKDEYGDLVFDSYVKHRAATGRIAFDGFEDNEELRYAVDQYKKVIKEFKKRVNKDG